MAEDARAVAGGRPLLADMRRVAWWWCGWLLAGTAAAPTPAPTPACRDTAGANATDASGVKNTSGDGDGLGLGGGDGDGAAGGYELGVQLGGRGADGTIRVARARVYKPWFSRLEDLAAMLREAIRAEAETVVARNRANRAKLRKTLAAMTVAVCHTRPNPNLRARLRALAHTRVEHEAEGLAARGEDAP